MQTALSQLYDDLSADKEVQALIQNLGLEWHNRNTFPIKGIALYSGDRIDGDEATKSFSILIALIENRLETTDLENLDGLYGDEKYSRLLKCVFLAIGNGPPNRPYLARLMIAALIEEHLPGIDEYVIALKDTRLMDELGLTYDKNYLVEIKPGMDLRPWALVLDEDTMVYPHQFLRRSFGANFVGTPRILRQYQGKNLSIKLRLDPFRCTIPRYYHEYIEADFWYGQHFTESLLMDKNPEPTFTKHGTSDFMPSDDNPLNPIHPIRCTVFRSKMMDTDLREFMIEEYVPLANPHDNKIQLPGFGERYTIQKFGHLIYDQNKRAFVHFDVAVRVFAKEDYATVFNAIDSGSDPGDKAGDRHKMYLIEGEFQLDLVEPLLYDFFMYNPHIEEYFFEKP